MTRSTVFRRRLAASTLAVALAGGVLVAGTPAQADDPSSGISGEVTELSFVAPGGPVAGVPVSVFAPVGESFVQVSGAVDVTDENGAYEITGLGAGTYRVCFGVTGQIVALKYVSQCFRNGYGVELGDDVEVHGGVTSDIDAALVPAFTDVALPEAASELEPVGGHPFWLEITTLAVFGITTGYDEADGSLTFRPSQPVLREQMAAFLYRMARIDNEGLEPEVDIPAESPFTDVAPTHVFYREILWLEQSGITTGYDEPGGTRTFRPAQPVLREQMAAFLYRYDGTDFVDEDGPEFIDVTAQNNVFFDEIEWMELEEITTGYDEGNGTRTYRPSQPVLREQMAAFIFRFQNLEGDEM
ncbi:S-layer homology domain-containing protein [Aeromicrobium marinum]|uniref:S-layer homology domain-containing protein n=1 Tax=Aeromicrobium marinum TaxID=219314 RepID=UPI0001BCE059|nr:S-layer homology domain-containing protein [Aeromicrobium marinum]